MKWQGPVYEGLKSFFQKKEDYETYSIPFPEILTDPVKTVERIKTFVVEKKINILAGTSLGGFYALTFPEKVFKIVMNPCLFPSIEVEQVKNKVTGEYVKVSSEVKLVWQKMEASLKDFSLLPEEARSAFGLFGNQDFLFHYEKDHTYKPLFEELFPSTKNQPNAFYIDGVHSFTPEQMELGLSKWEW